MIRLCKEQMDLPNQQYNLGNIIGRGGYGEVYTLPDHPELVIKISSMVSSCRQWSNEFAKITKTRNLIQNNQIYQSLTCVKMIDVKGFSQENTRCYMIMERVFRPAEGDCNAKTLNTKSATLQAQFGVEDSNLIHKGRGQFIGLKQIRSYLQACPTHHNATVETLCHELGLFIGLLHFVGMNDGYDIEVFLGREYVNPRLKLFVADFDLTEEIKEYNPSTIQRMILCLDSVPYFPSKDNPELFALFSNAYRSIANLVGVVDVADQVLAEYD